MQAELFSHMNRIMERQSLKPWKWYGQCSTSDTASMVITVTSSQIMRHFSFCWILPTHQKNLLDGDLHCKRLTCPFSTIRGKKNFLANALFQKAKVSKQLSSLTEVHGKSLPARVRLGGWARSHKPDYPCCEKFLHSSISPIHQLIIHACFRLACQKKTVIWWCCKQTYLDTCTKSLNCTHPLFIYMVDVKSLYL